jgi:nucleoside-diphosphate-sugar epimerase
MSEQVTVGVLGGSGFIGSRLVEWLILNDLAEVRPIVRSFRGLSRLARFDLDCRLADATDQARLETELQDCEVVFHCVYGGHETALKSVEATYRAAAVAGVRRLVYLSSSVVHGHNPAPGINETSELVINQPFEYNVSKVMAEHLLAELSRDGKVETVVLRPCIVFGPRSELWTAQLASQLLLKTAYLVEGGRGICNTIYVDNLVNAMWLASSASGAAGHSFLLTDGERVTWRDLYLSVAAAVNADPAEIRNVPLEEMRDLQRRAVRRKRLIKIRQSRVSRLAIGILPEKAKHVARAVAAPPQPRSGGTAVTPGRSPPIDPEIASLQWCESMLPIAKATSVLGYLPQVSFEQASERTAAWLRFARGHA